MVAAATSSRLFRARSSRAIRAAFASRVSRLRPPSETIFFFLYEPSNMGRPAMLPQSNLYAVSWTLPFQMVSWR
eukprot:m.126428 g.126428  ORF g.126428 m.126428 type:complete len:74 (+) comp11189_c0_seq4:3663-3884(+)